MKEHPINEILRTSMNNMNTMIDVNKVVGEPIVLPDNSIAIPLTKVTCGFGVAGSEFTTKNTMQEFSEELFPFGGGSGGGVSIIPSALIIMSDGKIKLMKVEKNNFMFEKVIDSLKDIVKK